jgi:HSP20 family protein
MAHDAFRCLPLFLPAADTRERIDWQPSVDIYRAPDGWLVKVDLAGVRPQDVEVGLSDRAVVVRGARRDCFQEQGYSYYRMEIAYSHFERRIDLPSLRLPAKVTTEYRDGMLIVRIFEESPRER